MAKDKEKKVSGEMNEEELENVAGGRNGVTVSKGRITVRGEVERIEDFEEGGQKWMRVKYRDGSESGILLEDNRKGHEYNIAKDW